MNKSELIARMTERLDGDRAAAVAAVNGVLEEIEGSVARGERVSLTGFGTFDRRERASRTGRNPRTGEVIQVGPSVVAVFRPGTGFKGLLTAADGVLVTAHTESNVPQTADTTSVAEVAAAPDGEQKAARAGKAGKKAGKNAGKKAGKKAVKASEKKPGKKAAARAR